MAEPFIRIWIHQSESPDRDAMSISTSQETELSSVRSGMKY